jgi:hypothetical protein
MTAFSRFFVDHLTPLPGRRWHLTLLVLGDRSGITVDPCRRASPHERLR